MIANNLKKVSPWAGVAGGFALGAATVAAVRRRLSPGSARLAERVRDEMLEVASFPSSIAVDVQDGRVELSGAVLPRDYWPIVESVLSIRGVRAVHDGLFIAERVSRGPLQVRRRHVDWVRDDTDDRSRWWLLAIGSSAAVAATVARGPLGALLVAFGAVLIGGGLTR